MYFKCIYLVSMKQKTNKKKKNNNVFGVQTKQNFWKTFLCSIQAAMVEFYIYLNSGEKLNNQQFFLFSAKK